MVQACPHPGRIIGQPLMMGSFGFYSSRWTVSNKVVVTTIGPKMVGHCIVAVGSSNLGKARLVTFGPRPI